MTNTNCIFHVIFFKWELQTQGRVMMMLMKFLLIVCLYVSDIFIVGRTNGVILTEFNHKINTLSIPTIQQIKNQVIEQSRKLFTQTYGQQVLHMTVQSFQIYYKAYCNVLFIGIFPSKYNHTLINYLFEKITLKYSQQTARIFGMGTGLNMKNIPNKLSKLQETQMKMFQNKIASVLREINGNSLLKYSSINDSAHSNVGEMGYTFKRVSQREQNYMTSYRELNKTNPMGQQFQQTMKKIKIMLSVKKYSVIFLYLVTFWIGLTIITSN